MTSPQCVRCGAPRAPGPECPHCGVVYAKAERFPRPSTPPSAAAVFAQEMSLEEARSELWLARLAVPGALVVSWLLVQTGMGRFFFRTFAGMWLHELGHATVAWLCGFPAFPGPWLTTIGEERSPVFALALMGGLGFAVWRGWTARDRLVTVAASAALVLQVIGTMVLSHRAADMMITFGGDAGSLVFGAAFMAAFSAPPGHKLHRDWLRWGLLVLGAAAFMDTFEEWSHARADVTTVGYGDEIEGVGDTDVTKLVDQFRWSIPDLVRRHMAVGWMCLLALVPLQVLHVRRAQRTLDEIGSK